MTEGVDPKPGSYASLERRVEALETGLNSVRTDLAMIQSDVRHGSEIANIHYKTVEAQNLALKVTIDKIEGIIDQALRDPQSLYPQQKAMTDEWLAWRKGVDELLTDVKAKKNQAIGARWIVVAAFVSISSVISIVAEIVRIIKP